MRDSIYTPAEVASQVVAHMPPDITGAVIDPTAGEGALLEAVRSRFGGAVRPLALDIDVAAVRRLSERDDWVVSKADTLDPRARRSARAWREARRGLSAVVLNPPFSYRGNGGTAVEYGAFSGRVAPAVEFLVVGLKELAPRHGYWAILPEGAVLADKHSAFWMEVHKSHMVKVLAHLPQHTFPGARVSTILVHIGPSGSANGSTQEAIPTGQEEVSRPAACVCVEVVRGRVPVHRASRSVGAIPGQMVPFVHTTDIGSRPQTSPRRHASESLADTAPFALLPRVGKWRPPFVVDVGRVVISDCLFALRPVDRLSFPSLVESLESNIDHLYKGTGAKYLTLRALTNELGRLGWRPAIVKAGNKVGTCTCARRDPAVVADASTVLR